MSKLSVIIRTFNESHDIEKTLKSITERASCFETVEIILVDNESTDNTVELSKPYVQSIVSISHEEFSWGRAINWGISKATGDLILITSGHCIIENESLFEAANYMEKFGLDVVYARQKGDVSKDKFETIELLADYPRKSYIVESSQKYFVCSNAGCLLKKSVWDSQKFDEYLLSAEDGEWAHRILSLGYRIGYCSKFEIIHGHPFNEKYIYKKWFYRSLVNDAVMKKSSLLFKTTLLFMVIKVIMLSIEYSKILKEENIVFGYKELYEYLMIREKAKRRARKCILFDEDESQYSKKVEAMK